MEGGFDKKGKVVPEAAHACRVNIRVEPVLHSHDAHLRARKSNQGAGAVVLGKYAAQKGSALAFFGQASKGRRILLLTRRLHSRQYYWRMRSSNTIHGRSIRRPPIFESSYVS
jgi:hypothetical protein